MSAENERPSPTATATADPPPLPTPLRSDYARKGGADELRRAFTVCSPVSGEVLGGKPWRATRPRWSERDLSVRCRYQCGIILSMALTLRTDEELERALDALANSEGLSRQEIIRRAVIERYERSRHVQRVTDSTERMMQRWGDVLDRLGPA